MGFNSTIWAYGVRDLTASERAVLVALAHCRNDKTGACFPGQETLVEMTGLSEKTVRRALSSLEGSALIKRTARFAGRYRTSDEYELLFDSHRSERPPVTVTTGQDDHRSESPSPPVTVSMTTGHSDHPIEEEQEVEQEEGNRKNSSSPPAREIESAFDEAYAHWPKKVEWKRSLQAFTAAARKRGVEQLTADVIAFGKAYAATTDRQYVPALRAWLKGERWTDELPTPPLPSDADWQAFLADGPSAGEAGRRRTRTEENLAFVAAMEAKYGPGRSGMTRTEQNMAVVAELEAKYGRPTRDDENLAVVARIAAREIAECQHRWMPDGTCNFCPARLGGESLALEENRP